MRIKEKISNLRTSRLSIKFFLLLPQSGREDSVEIMNVNVKVWRVKQYYLVLELT